MRARSLCVTDKYCGRNRVPGIWTLNRGNPDDVSLARDRGDLQGRARSSPKAESRGFAANALDPFSRVQTFSCKLAQSGDGSVF